LQLPVPDRAGARDGDGGRTQTVELDVKRSEAAGPLPVRSGRSPAATSASSASPAAGRDDRGPAAAAARQADVTARDQGTESAAASTGGPAPSPETGAEGDGWMVQLGSFSDEGNARRLAARVENFGYTARISNHTTSGRVMYRVRVGPIESRQRAEATASALSAHGFVAQLVAPG
jgi:DedD protein